MGNKTNIEWCDATWNPVTGCTKVSAGCKFCYAERVFQRPYPGRAFTDVRTHPERLEQPLHWREPKKIFVNSMSDLFHEDCPQAFLDSCFSIMALAAQHTFQILTKRPGRMILYCSEISKDSSRLVNCRTDLGLKFNAKNTYGGWPGWPLPNVWLGVSVEDQATADERIPILLQTPAAVRFVSYEPALGPVDFGWFLSDKCEACGGTHALASEMCGWNTEGEDRGNFEGLNWIIAGGESGPHARPSHPDWFRSVRDQCQAAGVKFFFKQWGEWAHWVDAVGNVCGLPKKRVTKNDSPTPGVIEWADMIRLGKKRAGRLLDGREWNEFPEVHP